MTFPTSSFSWRIAAFLRCAGAQEHDFAALQHPTPRRHVAVHQDQTRLAGTGGLG